MCTHIWLWNVCPLVTVGENKKPAETKTQFMLDFCSLEEFVKMYLFHIYGL